MSITLRPYQTEAIDAVRSAESRGLRRVLLSLPTGTGKTVVFAELVRQRGGRALILAHRDELLGQAARKVHDVWPEVRVGIVRAEQDKARADVVVGSVQTLIRPGRLERVLAAGALSTVIVDEAHHATANTYRDILERCGVYDDGGPLLVGVTATAFRSDGGSLGDIFEEVAYESGILPMIEHGYLVDVRAKRVTLEADFGFHVRAGDYAIGEVEDALMDADAPRHAAEAYVEHASGRKALIFTPTVRVAHAMADAFRAVGVACESLDGKTPTDERRGILRRLASGETTAVANCAVLTEGFDEPSVSCVVVSRPTRSKGLYCQMVGRGTRIYPGKQDLLILDMVGATGRHDLMTAAKLFDVPDRRMTERGESVLEAVAAVEDERAAVEGRRVTRDVDPFHPFHRDRLAWVPGAAGAHALSVGDGTVFLVPRGEDLWDVVLTGRSHRAVETIASGLSLSYAQGTAEDYARKRGASALIRSDAPWRSQPATSKQRDRIERWGLWRPDLTKGEASDIISARVARAASRGLSARAS